jgi:hypothetical protein
LAGRLFGAGNFRLGEGLADKITNPKAYCANNENDDDPDESLHLVHLLVEASKGLAWDIRFFIPVLFRFNPSSGCTGRIVVHVRGFQPMPR